MAGCRTPATTTKLFELIIIIADTMTTQPKEIEKLFDNLPDSKKEAIQKGMDSNRFELSTKRSTEG